MRTQIIVQEIIFQEILIFREIIFSPIIFILNIFQIKKIITKFSIDTGAGISIINRQMSQEKEMQ